MNKTHKRFVIKNKPVRIENIIFIGGTAALAWIMADDVFFNIFTCSFLVLSGIGIFFFIKRIKNQKPHVIIDNEGIEYCDENEFHKWSEISYAFIKSDQVKLHNGRTSSEDNFHIVKGRVHIKKKMEDGYKYSKKSVKKAVEHFSGREIGDFSDIAKDETIKILDGNKFTKEILNEFLSFSKKKNLIETILSLIVMGPSLLFQFVFDFTYGIAFGFLLTTFILWIINKTSVKNFKQKRYILDLTDKQYNKIEAKYNISYNSNFLISIVSISITIAVVSYYMTKG